MMEIIERYIDVDDWKSWWAKLKWLVISFRFLAFAAVSGLLIGFWISLINTYKYTINILTVLKNENIIKDQDIPGIIIHFQTVLFDLTVGHVSIAFTAVMTGIIALKGVQFYVKSSENKELLKQANTDQTVENIRKWLPKDFGKTED